MNHHHQWLYQGPIAHYPRYIFLGWCRGQESWQNYRVCKDCGECQEYAGTSLKRTRSDIQWLEVTFKQMQDRIKRDETLVLQEIQEKKDAAHAQAERNRKRIEDQVRRNIELEQGKKDALDWLRDYHTSLSRKEES